ncbi:hypothetical protein GCM10007857_46880 [Bradyrhizobium iriomotense]|uniref:eCIS core domain-containing protein n=1 Tax=Bradyrhizobium iriomotense TaxID=441950 RepID=A0ABQ6B3F7_9BRAD|nr:hypothetical protein GCM10007857_46880 [Bradyrhizobium iriomotense]
MNGAGPAPVLSQAVAASAASGPETLPIVRDVLRSHGEPLDAATRAVMEPGFGHDFGRVRIHKDAPAEGAAAALGAAAFTFGHHIAFARDRFRSGASQLMAHELAHTVQQAATSPQLALKPDPETPGPEVVRSAFDGALLGNDRQDRQILVKREVGDPGGYDDRLQAIAVARLGKAEPAAVALDKSDKWHAFETTTGIDVEAASANDPVAKAAEARARKGIPFKQVEFLPSLSGIEASKKGPDTTRAAYVLGVGESEIAFHKRPSEREAGKINLTENPGPGANSDARHGAAAGQEPGFKPGMITAFDIDKADLDTPTRAQGALFHEVTHLKDFEMAQRWVDLYQTETKRMFVGGPGLKYFQKWIDEQAAKKPPRLSAAEAELVVDIAADVSATTEARANIRTFLEFFRAGLFDDATRALTNYAAALPPVGREYGTPPQGSPVIAELTNELKAAFKRASKERKSQFEAAMAAARKANKDAWFSTIAFGR